jgi:hypothetical protein
MEARRQWQDEQLRNYEGKSYGELVALPRRAPLASPPHLPGMKFCVVRKAGANGGVEISVREFTRFLIFGSGIGPSFEMLPDGQLIREDTEHDPED